MTQATYQGTALVPLRELTPFPGNAKRGDTDTILASLRRHGQYRSLVVQHIPAPEPDLAATGELRRPSPRLIVLAGNHTMAAFTAHGSGDCGQSFTVDGEQRLCGVCQNDPAWEPAARCELVTCDEDTARRINLVDNRAADLGSYDPDALADLLSFMDEDYEATGYTESDVLRLLAPPPTIEELADTYRHPEDDGLWPVLRFTVPPEARDDFYDLTASCPNPGDDAARFHYLLDRARAAPQ
ncbi:hypothetical protein [Streptomyces halobius]|uniref:Nucleic acid/nucleotide deaminase of polymorphic system toxin n=1 Tax=Streptomyces halobius TaxID=2879846 RepID=A0ABY4MEV1_9ACTN|nr:hypothetical protein [Streptomyces halobius]UQA95638.1 hypothetical protein K9S39_30620 [Streptomyces halobius]